MNKEKIRKNLLKSRGEILKSEFDFIYDDIFQELQIIEGIKKISELVIKNKDLFIAFPNIRGFFEIAISLEEKYTNEQPLIEPIKKAIKKLQQETKCK